MVAPLVVRMMGAFAGISAVVQVLGVIALGHMVALLVVRMMGAFAGISAVVVMDPHLRHHHMDQHHLHRLVLNTAHPPVI